MTEQGQQTFSGKDQTVNVLGSAGHVVSVNSALVAQKRPQTTCKPVPVAMPKMLFMDTGI